MTDNQTESTPETYSCHACPDGRCFSKTKTCPLEFGSGGERWNPDTYPEEKLRQYFTVVD